MLATFKFVPLHDAQFEAAEKGRIDLLLVADDGTAPAHFAKEVAFGMYNRAALPAPISVVVIALG
jgi:hypothetical protein